MTRPLATYPDIERDTVDFLVDALTGCTVGVGIPTGWTRDSDPHVQVDLDGTPVDLHPVAQRSTIRVTAWSDSPTDAKELAQLAHGHLLASPPYLRGTGLFATHDPDHDAELASFTVRASVRSTPITGS